MAGFVLKIARSAQPGDFVTVADLTGRITEMGLLHSEVQTEFRDLITMPNLYMVTQPLKVVRARGTIVTAEVSLGYEMSHAEVSKVLRNAALESGLKDPFVHVRELGDFSVLYRVARLPEDVQSLISARSRLRESMLDALHADDIEIVSSTFMNSRVYSVDREFIPEPSTRSHKPVQVEPESVAFDKANDAASIEEPRLEIENIDKELAEGVAAENPPGDELVSKLEKPGEVCSSQARRRATIPAGCPTGSPSRDVGVRNAARTPEARPGAAGPPLRRRKPSP